MSGIVMEMREELTRYGGTGIGNDQETFGPEKRPTLTD
jgi:hypothetical protein